MKKELGHCFGRQASNSNLQLLLRRHARRKDDNFIALSYVVATNLLVLAYLALWHIWLRRDARDKRITAAGRKNSWKTDSLEFVVLFSLLIFVKMIKKRKAFLQEWHYYNNIDDMTLKWFRIVTMSHFKYLSNFYLCSLCIVKPCSHSVPVSRKFLDGCIFWHFSSSV